MDTIWTGVRERVLALRTAPGARRVFGATFKGYGHGLDLEPPVAEAGLPAAERVWGVTLPEEYRTFLLEVGASGAGPDYGQDTLTGLTNVPGWVAPDWSRMAPPNGH
ncbi:hypothetical protein ABZS71_23380 [Streptomyces sp. NPDC005393]|uniref:hypothetical protein n=1 Tax=Streptomyces sp. NPDC005393 TaxID=3157041 RepID=UPI0033B5F9B8